MSVVNRKIASMTRHLVGVAEIAQMLGVSRQRVDALVRKDGDFPLPEVELTAGRVWRRDDVIQWAERKGRRLLER